MELDFKSVKAISSPTRLEILNHVLDEEATTTKLSEDLGKSKSTISSHLKVLSESGLLKKDEKEGRRRVVYRPTDKARAIIEGKERKVRFSVISSALTGIGGVFLVGNYLRQLEPFQSMKSTAGSTETGSSGTMGAMDAGNQLTASSAEAANRTAEAATQGNFPMQEAAAVIGIGLIVTSLMALAYSYVLNRLRSE